jgi:hypothetical protein
MGVAAPALPLAIIMDLPLEAGVISNLGFFEVDHVRIYRRLIMSAFFQILLAPGSFSSFSSSRVEGSGLVLLPKNLTLVLALLLGLSE